MAVRKVLRYPHPALARIARELSVQEGDLAKQVAADMLDTMRAHPGCVGLAAPQLDELVRMVVVDVSEHPKAETSNGLLVLANPLVTGEQGAEVAREGCLSIPQLTANVRRATGISIEAVSLTGDSVRLESQGFEARCLLHEIDHLDGVLFLDRVDSVATDVFPRKQYR